MEKNILKMIDVNTNIAIKFYISHKKFSRNRKVIKMTSFTNNRIYSPKNAISVPNKNYLKVLTEFQLNYLMLQYIKLRILFCRFCLTSINNQIKFRS